MTSPQLRALPKTCSVEGCSRGVAARGWCNKHYQRWQRHGDPHTVLVSHEEQKKRDSSYVTPWNPWLHLAPVCPRCETNDLVLLRTYDPRRFYCLPCDRYVPEGRSESLTVACGSELGPGASSVGASGPSTEGGE